LNALDLHVTVPVVGFIVRTLSVEAPEPIPVNLVIPVVVSVPNVCKALHILAWPKAREAPTDPVVGDIVKVPSELVTELTAPPPPANKSTVVLPVLKLRFVPFHHNCPEIGLLGFVPPEEVNNKGEALVVAAGRVISAAEL
jgi:hypothetical protein